MKWWILHRWRWCQSACWGAVVAGIVMLYLVNSVLRTTTLSFYCETECNLKLWSKPLPPEHKLIVSYIRRNVLDSSQKHVLEPLTHNDLYDQPWRMVGHWHLIQEVIRATFINMHNGVFVEVGAGDGVFLSHTAWLEEEMGWSGLLIEPRQSSYHTLRQRRKAEAAQVCVSDGSYNHKDKLWQPSNTQDLPPMYRNVAEGKSTLFQYVAEEDRELGVISPVQCFTLDALLLAAGLERRIDLLVVHTMGGESKILDTLEHKHITLLLIRDRNGINKHDIDVNARRLNMIPYKDIPPVIDNFDFFINKNVDLIKKEEPK